MKRVLIIQYSSNRDGSAFSGLLTANGLREAGWITHVAFGFDGPIIANYKEARHATYVVPHKNWLRRRRSLHFVKDVASEWGKAQAFERLIEQVKPDVVYINTTVSLAGAVAARRRHIPCVWHLREMFADIGGEMQAPHWAVPAIRRLIRAFGTKLISNSRATSRNLLGASAAGNAGVIPNAVSARFFEDERTSKEVRCELGLPPDVVIVGVPGTLRPMKGHLFFMGSIAPLLHERPDIHVAMTGGLSTDYAQQVVRLVDELGIAQQVHFLEWVQDMPAFYRACDLVCVPSRAEPFGRTVIEAFASGVPVVATAVGGIRETITQGETGLLTEYGDELAVTEAVRMLLENRELRHRMSERARQVAYEEYHECVYKQRIQTVVDDLMNYSRPLQGAPALSSTVR